MKLIKIKRRKPNRSRGGDLGVYIMLILFGLFFVMPLVYAISSAFKPLDEIYLYPPRFFVKNPTFNNFQDLLVVMSSSYVPFTRYVFNTVLTTLVGTLGHLLIGSMAAYVLAKYDFPLGKGIFNLIQSALMFNAYVLMIPTYLVMSNLGWVDTYLALIVPAFALPMGLFLMKQFMEQIPDALIEAAKIDGAKEGRIYLQIVMPNVKPAWLTVTIFSVQTLWNQKGQVYIYSEEYKMLPYALQQIMSGGVARAGVGSAATMVVMMVPIVIFIAAQSNILETMASSGIKD
ncbi:carbohydrate ABC transporter permease [Eubacterium xylanophilum]|uniref:carbohydrate ABC transporter permease n=1 Tax=Eubacterium xylanophilum TaxID=39497 RepID=UPI00047DF67E|nr:carbohydrate ABC transporter permease [Eubacterium xylanophilum]